MNEIEYSQLAGHITEKLDNTAEYEDWLIIQNYVEELQSNLTKEQLAYINLRDTFNNLQQDNQELKELMVNLFEEFRLKNVSTATEYNLVNMDYEIRRRKENCLKEHIKYLEKQLKQRDEVIEECIESIQNFMTHIDDGFCADMMTFIDILNKYKGVDENESN